MAKKSPREMVLSALRAIVSYQHTIKTGEMILGFAEVQKDPSSKAAQTALVRDARENLLSEYNGVFRRISEHLDGLVRDSETGVIDAENLEQFAAKILSFKVSAPTTQK